MYKNTCNIWHLVLYKVAIETKLLIGGLPKLKKIKWKMLLIMSEFLFLNMHVTVEKVILGQSDLRQEP